MTKKVISPEIAYPNASILLMSSGEGRAFMDAYQHLTSELSSSLDFFSNVKVSVSIVRHSFYIVMEENERLR